MVVEAAYDTRAKRLMTFTEWNRVDFTRMSLSAAGFYYTPNRCIKCFSCGLLLPQHELLLPFTAWTIHAAFAPNCPYILEKTTDDFRQMADALNGLRARPPCRLLLYCGYMDGYLTRQEMGNETIYDNIVKDSMEDDFPFYHY